MPRICVPVAPDGSVGGHWGRAARVAVAEVEAGTVTAWDEFDVGWGDLHDTETEGGHHARIARFLLDHQVKAVVAQGMGPGMVRMLDSMGIAVRVGVGGDARAAVSAV